MLAWQREENFQAGSSLYEQVEERTGLSLWMLCVLRMRLKLNVFFLGLSISSAVWAAQNWKCFLIKSLLERAKWCVNMSLLKKTLCYFFNRSENNCTTNKLDIRLLCFWLERIILWQCILFPLCLYKWEVPSCESIQTLRKCLFLCFSLLDMQKWWQLIRSWTGASKTIKITRKCFQTRCCT